MMRPFLTTALAIALLRAAGAQTLTFDIRPGTEPARWVACTLRLEPPWITLIEVEGAGMPPRQQIRWPAGPRDRALVEAAIAALASGALPPTDPNGSRRPEPPNLSVTWIAGEGPALRSGYYQQSGLALPPVLAELIGGIIPGGSCARTLGQG